MTGPETATHEDLAIPAGGVELPAHLAVPPYAERIVVFVHGSGSSRRSARNRYIAERLFEAGYGSLLFDLLTEEEDRSYAARFDVDRISARLLAATRWIGEQPRTRGMHIGYFGANTGAAAALRTVAALAAEDAEYVVRAMVSRGGRPDLAMDHLESVTVPTLLIVGERDADVLRLNETARNRLAGEAALEIVPRAGHLFDEPGAIERVADLTIAWFSEHL
jgi:dienelactone hydrolase